MQTPAITVFSTIRRIIFTLILTFLIRALDDFLRHGFTGGRKNWYSYDVKVQKIFFSPISEGENVLDNVYM